MNVGALGVLTAGAQYVLTNPNKIGDAMKKYLCGLCDQQYDDSNAHEHDHHEPQSGPYRTIWIASGLPYDEWIKTSHGIEWNFLRNPPQNPHRKCSECDLMCADNNFKYCPDCGRRYR